MILIYFFHFIHKQQPMFSAFANPFHKPEKSLSEKGLSGTLYYANKSSRDVAQLADDNRVAANNLMSYGSMLGDDLTVSEREKKKSYYSHPIHTLGCH